MPNVDYYSRWAQGTQWASDQNISSRPPLVVWCPTKIILFPQIKQTPPSIRGGSVGVCVAITWDQSSLDNQLMTALTTLMPPASFYQSCRLSWGWLLYGLSPGRGMMTQWRLSAGSLAVMIAPIITLQYITAALHLQHRTSSTLYDVNKI